MRPSALLVALLLAAPPLALAQSPGVPPAAAPLTPSPTPAGDPSSGGATPSAPAPALPPTPAAGADPCRVPSADLATPAPLTRLAEALAAREPVLVLAYGSSSTVGVGASSPRAAYPARLEELLDGAFKGIAAFDVQNRGVSGETAALTAERIRNEVAKERPALVLWQVGTNDALSRVPAEEVGATVRRTLRWLKETGADAVIVGMQYTLKYGRDEHYRAVRDAVRDAAAAEGAPLIKRYEAMQRLAERPAPVVGPDGLHLNDLGYRCMAEHVARGIVASVFTDARGRAAPPRTGP